MHLKPLTAIGSVDGRYRDIAAPLAPFFSEYGLIRHRIQAECEYLIVLSETRKSGMRALTEKEKKFVREIPAQFSLADAEIVKRIEREGYQEIPATKHDVKAVEYFLRLRLAATSLKDVQGWLHFGLTSEDVNSVAYGLSLRGALEEVLLPALKGVQLKLHGMAVTHATTVMLARTHGQPASPTTFGKEMRVFERRLARQPTLLTSSPILVKWSGATGNYSAQALAMPAVNWVAFSKNFIKRFNTPRKIQLEFNETTTQIEPHDTYAELFDTLRRVNTICIDFCQDMWRYISDGWVGQDVKAGEVGSSTMPHKVNPIDFENAEGNLGVANALFEYFSRKLPISRLQRDLSDSTVERNFGSAFAHCLIAYEGILRGLSAVRPNEPAMAEELARHPEVLAEAVQIILRRENIPQAYEALKSLTRGKEVSLQDLHNFIQTLPVSPAVKKKLLQLTPQAYIGYASALARGNRKAAKN